jgi:hypothetical protein
VDALLHGACRHSDAFVSDAKHLVPHDWAHNSGVTYHRHEGHSLRAMLLPAPSAVGPQSNVGQSSFSRLFISKPANADYRIQRARVLDKEALIELDRRSPEGVCPQALARKLRPSRSGPSPNRNMSATMTQDSNRVSAQGYPR